ncbi:MAG TPA: efflux RND transporter periplasmic adaptor subunit [Candidatus Udaeobacter sp.]|nr:efflux RND transporter periplasmic adaptor subunit [Candidatus Udaeobacter sp.]
MKRRMLITIAAIVLFIAVIGVVKFMQIRAAIAAGAAFQMPPEAVTTVVAKAEDWPATQGAIGNVEAVHGVTVSADLPGVVVAIDFDSGKKVRKGQILVRLDTRQERAQLKAADAQAELSRLNLERMSMLKDKKVASDSEYDRMDAEFKEADARLGEIKAMIERKEIRAPFDGMLGIRQVNLGQYLNAGDPIVPLQMMDPIHVNFSLPQQAAGTLKIGAEVTVAAEGVKIASPMGKITAINSVIDEATRNIQVQATLANADGSLRPGMFVDVKILLGDGQPVIALPASAINFAPYGNSVFVVAEMTDPKGAKYKGVNQQFVKLGEGRGDQVAVLSGVKSGDEVVTSGVFKLRNGAAVLVDNSVQPGNNPSAKPEDS